MSTRLRTRARGVQFADERVDLLDGVPQELVRSGEELVQLRVDPVLLSCFSEVSAAASMIESITLNAAPIGFEDP
jgi:hypothetical protein